MNTVGQLLAKKGYRVWTVDADDNLYVAAGRMMDRSVHSMIVLEGGRPAGIVTSTDITRAVANHPESAARLLVRDYMTESLAAADEGDDLATTQAMMVERRIHHLPVTRNGDLVGVLDLLDVVKRQLQVADLLTEDLEAYISGTYPR